jgi:hypothetical protein
MVLAVVLAGACAQPIALSHFDSDGLSFDYPSTWNAATFDMQSNFSHWWVWLSTDLMADPCDRVSNSEVISITCDRSPVVGKLRPNGVLLDWASNGWLGWPFDANAGESISVDGVDGTLEVLAADSDCVAVDGDTQIRVIVPRDVPHNWTELDGCINGKFEGPLKDQIMAMLASVDWT